MNLTSIPHNEHVFLLVGDIGGTNTTIALMEARFGALSCVKKASFLSAELNGIEQALATTLPDFLKITGYQGIRGACFTAAGPVGGNGCQLTNIPWALDGNTIAQTYGFPTFVINDLSGISYGLPTLDPSDSSKIIEIRHPDGTFPNPTSLNDNTEVRAVLAPGTGLGVGYLINQKGQYCALPSEGGHMDWAAFSEQTRQLQVWLNQKTGTNPGAEQYISGMGIENLFAFLVETAQFSETEATKQILSTTVGQRAMLISQHSSHDALCQNVMELFVDMCARFASSLALWMLPRAGLYLAGGIPGKNLPWFINENRFMRSFLQSYRAGMEKQLHQIPVYLITDYSINLYGAAHAWFCLSE